MYYYFEPLSFSCYKLRYERAAITLSITPIDGYRHIDFVTNQDIAYIDVAVYVFTAVSEQFFIFLFFFYYFKSDWYELSRFDVTVISFF